MSAVGEANALVCAMLDRLTYHKDSYHMDELEDDLWEVRRLLESSKDTSNGN